MWLNPQIPADLVTFTEEILNRTLHFLFSEMVDSESDNIINTSEIKYLKRFFWNSKSIFKDFLLKDFLLHFLLKGYLQVFLSF